MSRKVMIVGATMHRMLIEAGVPDDQMVLNELPNLEPPTDVRIESRQQGKIEALGSREQGIPDRISMLRGSPFYGPCECIGVRLDGQIKDRSVVEFCVSGGWLRIAKPGADGKLTAQAAQSAEKVFGKVDVFWKCQPSRQTRRQLARL